MYRVRSVYDRVQNKLSERLTVEGKWIRRSASYRVRTQRTEALARQMKATCGITECARSAWTGIQNDSVLRDPLSVSASQIRVGHGRAR
jgi:hypothetical protein